MSYNTYMPPTVGRSRSLWGSNSVSSPNPSMAASFCISSFTSSFNVVFKAFSSLITVSLRGLLMRPASRLYNAGTESPVFTARSVTDNFFSRRSRVNHAAKGDAPTSKSSSWSVFVEVGQLPKIFLNSLFFSSGTDLLFSQFDIEAFVTPTFSPNSVWLRALRIRARLSQLPNVFAILHTFLPRIYVLKIPRIIYWQAMVFNFTIHSAAAS